VIDLSAAGTGSPRERYLIGIPLFLLMALVLPLLLLLAPFALIASLAIGVNPGEAARVVWGVLVALRGTHVEVVGRNRAVLIHLS